MVMSSRNSCEGIAIRKSSMRQRLAALGPFIVGIVLLLEVKIAADVLLQESVAGAGGTPRPQPSQVPPEDPKVFIDKLSSLSTEEVGNSGKLSERFFNDSHAGKLRIQGVKISSNSTLSPLPESTVKLAQNEITLENSSTKVEFI
ncbi:hypothetical protein ACHAW6_000051 [Cyclotella cf. meneghiniana]